MNTPSDNERTELQPVGRSEAYTEAQRALNRHGGRMLISAGLVVSLIDRISLLEESLDGISARVAEMRAEVENKAAEKAAAERTAKVREVGYPMQGRIKVGALISQDHGVYRWPQCVPPRRDYPDGEYRLEATDPDMVFTMRWHGTFWECKADGYGCLRHEGDEGIYGNGSIIASDGDVVAVESTNE